MDRRSFLRTTGLSAGGLLLPSARALAETTPWGEEPAPDSPPSARGGRTPDVVVVGAGAFGLWTAFYLQEMGAQVTLVDLYGPGNSRSTSGDETRGVRTSYPGRELWAGWAARSIDRWKAFDATFAESMGGSLYFTTGDLIFRDTAEGFHDQVREVWGATGVPHESLTPEEVRYRWPQIQIEGMTHILHEPGAGVVRARAACQRVAALFQHRGGELVLGHAVPPTDGGGGRLETLLVEGAGTIHLSASQYVFALGPWFVKAFQDVPAMEGLFRIPMGNVVYYGTPPGDQRFSYPNIPSWNFAGVTGWPSLPPDFRGFRVRASGQTGDDPDTSNRWVPEAGLERPRAILAERFPDLALQPILETRACHYETPATRDWLIDRHPGLENVWFAGGGSAEGFKFGPTVGELIASRVLGDSRFADLDAEFRLPDPE
jgi:sarcosine oxidase